MANTASGTEAVNEEPEARMQQLIITTLLVFAQSCAWAADAGSAPEFTLKQAEPSTGTNIKRDVVKGGLPHNKRYSELTLEEQARVKSQYEQMGPGDEPPFPVNGLGPIYKAIAAGQRKLAVEGLISLVVDVDSLGEAVSVSVLHSDDPKMTSFVAAVLMNEHYKPALCKGTPCKMQFPFRMEFKLVL